LRALVLVPIECNGAKYVNVVRVQGIAYTRHRFKLVRIKQSQLDIHYKSKDKYIKLCKYRLRCITGVHIQKSRPGNL
jgi:hypothetical protein